MLGLSFLVYNFSISVVFLQTNPTRHRDKQNRISTEKLTKSLAYCELRIGEHKKYFGGDVPSKKWHSPFRNGIIRFFGVTWLIHRRKIELTDTWFALPFVG